MSRQTAEHIVDEWLEKSAESVVRLLDEVDAPQSAYAMWSGVVVKREDLLDLLREVREDRDQQWQIGLTNITETYNDLGVGILLSRFVDSHMAEGYRTPAEFLTWAMSLGDSGAQ